MFLPLILKKHFVFLLVIAGFLFPAFAVAQDQAAVGEEASEEDVTKRYIYAARKGVPETLQLLRPEYVEQVPGYPDSIIPQLKRTVLDSLVARIRSGNWQKWPDISRAVGTAATPAEEYIDNVTSVNPHLGRFMETSSYLLAQMYRVTLDGKPFDSSTAMKDLSEKAEVLLAHRAASAISPRELIDITAIEDPAFVAISERLRGEFFSQFVARAPGRIGEQFFILDTLVPQYCGDLVLPAVTQLIGRLSLEASADFRTGVLPLLADSQVLDALSSKSEDLAKLIAQLYVVYGVDALEQGKQGDAERFLAVSEQTFGGLASQESLRRVLPSEPPMELQVPEEESEIDSEKIEDIFAEETESDGGSSLSFILIIALLVGVGIFAKRLYSRRLDSVDYDFSSNDSFSVSDNDTPRSSAREQGNINLSEEADLDELGDLGSFLDEENKDR